MEPKVIITVDNANRLYALSREKDEQLNNLLDQIDEHLEGLNRQDLSLSQKYQAVVICEYIFVRARTLVDFEHIKVK